MNERVRTRCGVYRPVAIVLLIVSGGCGTSSAPTSANEWIGEISTDGTATTVRNISGSIWGGHAKLVPEVEIGVAEGADEYMLGRPMAIHGTDEGILVADLDATIVRVYDWDGNFLSNLGKEGQGPGEYGFPAGIGAGPDGRLFVSDFGAQRMLVFSAEGEYEDQWIMTGAGCCIVPMLVAHDGTVYLESTQRVQDQRAIASFAPDGTPGVVTEPPEYEVPDYTVEFRGQAQPTLFAPRSTVWAIGYGGETISSPGHEVRIRIDRADGTTLYIERQHEPVPVDADEEAWHRRWQTASFRELEPDWSWNAAATPQYKPAIWQMIPAPDGRLWVLRQGPGLRLSSCDPTAQTSEEFVAGQCWRDSHLFDVYEYDGRFLGSVAVPDEVILWTARPWISGDTFIAHVEDAEGIYKIVRFRLDLTEASTSAE